MVAHERTPNAEAHSKTQGDRACAPGIRLGTGAHCLGVRGKPIDAAEASRVRDKRFVAPGKSTEASHTRLWMRCRPRDRVP